MNLKFKNNEKIITLQSIALIVYTKNHVTEKGLTFSQRLNWLNNGNNLHRFINMVKTCNPGAGAFFTAILGYSVMNDELMEYLVLGTDNVASWFEALILEGEKGYKFTAKVDVSENHYSQGNLDSLNLKWLLFELTIKEKIMKK